MTDGDESWRQDAIQPRKKLFIQMSGAPGSGKSTLAWHIRQHTEAVIVDHDILRSSLLADGAISFAQAAKSAYRLQWDLAQTMMKQGHNVIIDSTCNYRQVIDEGMALAKTLGHEYWYIESNSSDIALLDARLRLRKGLRSQRASVDSYPEGCAHGEDSRERFERWMKEPCRPTEQDDARIITVDSSNGLEQNQTYILRSLLHNTTIRVDASTQI
jgi:predicted kinase